MHNLFRKKKQNSECGTIQEMYCYLNNVWTVVVVFSFSLQCMINQNQT